MRPLLPLVFLAGSALPATALAGAPQLTDAFSASTTTIGVFTPVQQQADDAPAPAVVVS